MREAIITEEPVDFDVCYGDYDGHVTRMSYEVAFFVDGNEDPVDRHYYKTETVAKNAASLFERGLYYTGQYGGVEFEEC
jgi:hypothetical protein